VHDSSLSYCGLAVAELKGYGGYSAAAIEALAGLVEYWRLTLQQRAALVGAPEKTVSEWLDDPEHARLRKEHQQRILLLCGIYSDLHSFYGDVPAADEWPHRANQDFDGRTPLIRMLDGVDGLREVAAYTRTMAE